MAVTITLESLAVALRVIVRPGQTIDEGQREILDGLLDVATGAVDSYAADTPAKTANEAVIRMAGYIFDVTPAGRSMEAPNAFILSGARALLAPYYVPRSARVRA